LIKQEHDDPVHSLERPILYREFVEGLVRISAAVYEEDELKKTLPEMFSALLDGPIKEGSRTSVSAAGGKPSGGSKKKASLARPDPVMAALATSETRAWLQTNEPKLRDVFQRYGHVGFGGQRDITLYSREFASLWKECGVVVQQNAGGGGGAKKEETKEETSADGEEEAEATEPVPATVSHPQGMSLMEVVLMFSKQKFSGKGDQSNDVGTDGASSDSSGRFFDAEDDETNFSMEMNYNEFIEMCCRIALTYHPVLYGRQCVADAIRLKEEEAAAKIAAEEAAAEAAAEGEAEEAAAVVAEGEAGVEAEAAAEEEAEVVAEEEAEVVVEDPSRLKETTEVLPALARMCEMFLFALPGGSPKRR